MDKLRDKLIIEPLLRLLDKHPLLKRLVVFILLIFTVSSLLILAVKQYNDGWRPKLIANNNQYGFLLTRNPLSGTTESQNIADTLAPNKEPEPQFKTDCQQGWVCSDFDEKDFSGWDEYSINQLNTRSIQVSADSVYDNPHLFFRNSETKIDFTVKLKAVPRNQQKGNVVILWNETWRCIIGESDYNKVTCEGNYNNSENSEREQKFLSGLDKEPISPDNELIIEIKSSFVPSESKNKILMTLNYIDISGNREGAEFEWFFNLKTADIENYKQLIGVGIIDPNDEKIEVEFKRLELLPSK